MPARKGPAPKRVLSHDDQEVRYREIMGDDALVRQKRLSEDRLPCCGMARVLGHAGGCRYAARSAAR